MLGMFWWETLLYTRCTSINKEWTVSFIHHSLILSLLIKLDFVPWMLILILYMYHSILNRINWSKLTNLKIHAFQQVLRIRRKNRKQWLFLALNNLINCYSAAYCISSPRDLNNILRYTHPWRREITFTGNEKLGPFSKKIKSKDSILSNNPNLRGLIKYLICTKLMTFFFFLTKNFHSTFNS